MEYLRSILVDNPVLRRELRRRVRWRIRGPFWFAVACTAVAVLIYYYSKWMGELASAGYADAQSMWGFITNALLVLIVFLAPSLSAAVVSQEREQQTWEGLSITRLTASQVLFGKWLARQAEIGVLFVLFLPVAIVSGVHSDMSGVVIAAAYLYLMLNAAFFSTIGIYCSYWIRRTPAATATALLLTALVCIGTVIIDEILQSYLTLHDEFITAQVNPFVALNVFTPASSGSSQTDTIAISIVFECLIILVCFLVMGKNYGKAVS